MRVRSIAAIALFGSLVLPAHADSLADGVAAMPTAVEDVRVVGTFEAGGKSGSYRVVIARSTAEPPTARLFVQRLVKGADGTETVERSVEIKELLEMKRDINDYAAEPDENGLSLFVEFADSNTEGGETWELFMNRDSSYTFGPASN